MNISVVDIYDTLYQLGFKADNTGFFYLSYAAYCCLRSPHPEELLNDQLYVMVGKHYNTSLKQVRRAMHHTIAAAWNDTPEKITAMTNVFVIRQPSNMETIRLVLHRVEAAHGLLGQNQG